MRKEKLGGAGKRITHTDQIKCLLTSNCFKCKWVKLSNQKTGLVELKQDPATAWPQETHLRSRIQTGRSEGLEKDIPQKQASDE